MIDIDALVSASQWDVSADGCCAGPEWRGHLCQYHQGYADGAAAYAALLEAEACAEFTAWRASRELS